MYVCMCVCVCMYVCMYVCVCVCRYVCMYVCMCVYVCMYVRVVCMCVCVCVCVYVCMYVCMYSLCMYVYKAVVLSPCISQFPIRVGSKMTLCCCRYCAVHAAHLCRKYCSQLQQYVQLEFHCCCVQFRIVALI